jgi:hypothetical protein
LLLLLLLLLGLLDEARDGVFDLLVREALEGCAGLAAEIWDRG